MSENDNIGVVVNNNFSVDRELKTILENGVANKTYFVILSDSNKLWKDKKHKEKHKVKIASSFQLNDLRNRLLKLEMQDGGIIIQSKSKPEKPPIWLYIIDKG